ncbi:hypothetical protein LINPERPRIM_LOCUS984 [Linum perenne]
MMDHRKFLVPTC